MALLGAYHPRDPSHSVILTAQEPKVAQPRGSMCEYQPLDQVTAPFQSGPKLGL